MQPLKLVVLLVCGVLFTVIRLAAQANEPKIISDNTRFREMHPLLAADGETLYFTRGQHPRNQGAADSGDIWLRQRQADGSWGRALNAGGPINSFFDDQLIGLSASGRRMAVLRLGDGVAFVDILQQGQRSWRILESRELPAATDPGFSATYDLETNRIVYCHAPDGQSDLFTTQALSNDRWTEPQALSLLNSPGNESVPIFAPGGDQLYFRRDGRWYRADFDTARNTFGQESSLAANLSARFLEVTFSVEHPESFVATTDESGQDERLIGIPATVAVRPSAAKLLRGKVSVRQVSNLHDLNLAIRVGDRERVVYPDQEGQYVLVVPAEGFDRIRAEVPGYFASVQPPERGGGPPPLASETPVTAERYSDAYYQREDNIRQLHQKIAATSQEIEELRQQRQLVSDRIRREQLAAGREVLSGYIDPELQKLRSQIDQAQIQLNDTLPPARATLTPKTGAVDTLAMRPTIRSERNAATLDELEVLRARFRATQEARMGQAGEDYNWKSADPALVRKSAERQINEELIPTISRELAQDVYRKQQIDSLAMEQSIRQSLFPSNTPAVYERQAWETEIVRDIRPAAETALREKLREPIVTALEEEVRIQNALENRNKNIEGWQDSLRQQLEAQLAEESQRPTTYGNPRPEFSRKGTPEPRVRPAGKLELVPLKAGNTLQLSEVGFAPNSAYFKNGATQQLDRLATQLAEYPELRVEIGVHCNASLSHSAAQHLSQQRADHVLDYLVGKGVNPARLTAVGYGREKPLVAGSSIEGRLRNQRVEAVILE